MNLRISCTAQRRGAPSQNGTIHPMCQALLMVLCLQRQFAWMQNRALDCTTICIIFMAIQKELSHKSRQIFFLNVIIGLISSFHIYFFSAVVGSCDNSGH